MNFMIDSYNVRTTVEKMIVAGLKPSTLRVVTATPDDVQWICNRLNEAGWNDVRLLFAL